MPNTTENAAAKPASDFAEFSIATVGGLALALIAMFLVVVPLAGTVTSTRDFVVFWATGQQLVHHASPYDAAGMRQIERSAGLPAGYGILYMRNPPWSLPLAWPLGLVGLRIGALVWSLILLACLILSGWLMRMIHGRPPNRIHWLAFSFAPSLLCLFMGQTALFALLGLALFLRLNQTHPFLAGLSLWLCILKPHLFLPFGIVLLVWVVTTRSYRILAGVTFALALSSGVAWLMDPSAWSDYLKMMNAPAIEKEFIPCLSVAMKLWLRPEATWLQYLPAGLACGWALAYYWQRREKWNWVSDGGLLVLVSLVAAPYCWLYDQAVAMPALLDSAYTTRSRHLLTALALINIPIVIALICGIKIISAFYLWTAPAWLVLYLFARWSMADPTAEDGRDDLQRQMTTANN